MLVVVTKDGKRIAVFEHFYSPKETLGLNIAKAAAACYPDDPQIAEWVRRETKRAAGCHSGVYGDLGIVVVHGANAFAGGTVTSKP